MKNYTIAFLLLFIGTAFTSQAQAPVIPQEVKENIKSRVQNEITPAIVVGLVSPEGTTYFSFGVKSLETKTAVDEHSIFEIGSISKTFTGILLADMVVRGELDLDEPLQNLLPEGVSAPTRNGESIRLYHLANHTSGLPRLPNNMNPSNPANPYADYSKKQMYEFLNSYELTRDIGSEFEYSNYAVGLLGNVLAAKIGLTYEELMLEVIAKPLGMSNTSIVFTPRMKENLAYGHNIGLQVENWDLPTLAGAGAIRSSASDMIKYLSANMGILKSNIYSPMRLTHEVTTAEEIEQKVGLGWIINKSDSAEYIWHNGATGGYNTFTGFKKDGSLGVIVLTNSESGVTDIGMHLLDSSKALRIIKPSIGTKVKHILDNKGIRKARKVYWTIKENDKEAYNFGEEQLNALGYHYLGNNDVKKAIAVLKLNTEAFPESSNAYDSYAEALVKNKDKKKAIKNYKKSVELNPGNTNAIEMLKELGIETTDMVKEVTVNDATLKSYVGDYELAPGFILTISKEGNQLLAQATGQGAASIFPKTENEFYYKIVNAQIVFNVNQEGKVESLTLFQGGQELVGVKK